MHGCGSFSCSFIIVIVWGVFYIKLVMLTPNRNIATHTKPTSQEGVQRRQTAVQDLQSLEMQIREVIDEQRRRNMLFMDAEAQEAGEYDDRPGSGNRFLMRGMTPDTPPLSRGSITALTSIREDEEESDPDEKEEEGGGIRSQIRPGTSVVGSGKMVDESGKDGEPRTQSAPSGLFVDDRAASAESGAASADESGSGGGAEPFLMAPPVRSRPPVSAKEWHHQNKEELRNPTIMAGVKGQEYIPTAEDEAEAREKELRELQRKRNRLRNKHPFLGMVAKDREQTMEGRYGAAVGDIFTEERVRLAEQKRLEAIEAKKEQERAEAERLKAEAELAELMANETPEQREKREARDRKKAREAAEREQHVREEIAHEHEEEDEARRRIRNGLRRGAGKDPEADLADLHGNADTDDAARAKTEDMYDFRAEENRLRAKKARKAAAAASREAARRERGGLALPEDAYKDDKSGGESDSSDSDLEWRHGWDEHMPSPKSLRRKRQSQRPSLGAAAEDAGEGQYHPSDDSDFEEHVGGNTLVDQDANALEDSGTAAGRRRSLSRERSPSMAASAGDADAMAMLDPEEQLRQDEANIEHGVKVFGNFEVTLVPNGYMSRKREADAKAALRKERLMKLEARRKKIEAAKAAATVAGESDGTRESKATSSPGRPTLSKPAITTPAAQKEEQCDWRRSAPPAEITKRAANSAASKDGVDASKWLVGHSVSITEARTQGVDPLLNVARHVGHYAGVALTSDARERRFQAEMEKARNNPGSLDHPEELMAWGATASYKRNREEDKTVVDTGEGKKEAAADPEGLAAAAGACDVEQQYKAKGAPQTETTDECTVIEGPTLDVEGSLTTAGADMMAASAGKEYKAPRTAPASGGRRLRNPKRSSPASTSAGGNKPATTAGDFEQSLPPLSPPPRSAPGGARPRTGGTVGGLVVVSPPPSLSSAAADEGDQKTSTSVGVVDHFPTKPSSPLSPGRPSMLSNLEGGSSVLSAGSDELAAWDEEVNDVSLLSVSRVKSVSTVGGGAVGSAHASGSHPSVTGGSSQLTSLSEIITSAENSVQIQQQQQQLQQEQQLQLRFQLQQKLPTIAQALGPVKLKVHDRLVLESRKKKKRFLERVASEKDSALSSRMQPELERQELEKGAWATLPMSEQPHIPPATLATYVGDEEATIMAGRTAGSGRFVHDPVITITGARAGLTDTEQAQLDASFRLTNNAPPPSSSRRLDEEEARVDEERIIANTSFVIRPMKVPPSPAEKHHAMLIFGAQKTRRERRPEHHDGESDENEETGYFDEEDLQPRQQPPQQQPSPAMTPQTSLMLASSQSQQLQQHPSHPYHHHLGLPPGRPQSSPMLGWQAQINIDPVHEQEPEEEEEEERTQRRKAPAHSGRRQKLHPRPKTTEGSPYRSKRKLRSRGRSPAGSSDDSEGEMYSRPNTADDGYAENEDGDKATTDIISVRSGVAGEEERAAWDTFFDAAFSDKGDRVSQSSKDTKHLEPLQADPRERLAVKGTPMKTPKSAQRSRSRGRRWGGMVSESRPGSSTAAVRQSDADGSVGPMLAPPTVANVTAHNLVRASTAPAASPTKKQQLQELQLEQLQQQRRPQPGHGMSLPRPKPSSATAKRGHAARQVTTSPVRTVVGEGAHNRDDTLEVHNYLQGVRMKYGTRSKSAKRLSRAVSELHAAAGMDLSAGADVENPEEVERRIMSSTAPAGAMTREIRKRQHKAQQARTRQRDKALMSGSRSGLEPLRVHEQQQRGSHGNVGNDGDVDDSDQQLQQPQQDEEQDPEDVEEQKREAVQDLARRSVVRPSTSGILRRSITGQGSRLSASSSIATGRTASTGGSGSTLVEQRLKPPATAGVDGRPATSPTRLKRSTGDGNSSLLDDITEGSARDLPLRTAKLLNLRMRHVAGASRSDAEIDALLYGGVRGSRVQLALTDAMAHDARVQAELEAHRATTQATRMRVWDGYKQHVGLSLPMQAAYAELYPDVYKSDVSTADLASMLGSGVAVGASTVPLEDSEAVPVGVPAYAASPSLQAERAALGLEAYPPASMLQGHKLPDERYPSSTLSDADNRDEHAFVMVSPETLHARREKIAADQHESQRQQQQHSLQQQQQQQRKQQVEQQRMRNLQDLNPTPRLEEPLDDDVSREEADLSIRLQSVRQSQVLLQERLHADVLHLQATVQEACDREVADILSSSRMASAAAWDGPSGSTRARAAGTPSTAENVDIDAMLLGEKVRTCRDKWNRVLEQRVGERMNATRPQLRRLEERETKILAALEEELEKSAEEEQRLESAAAALAVATAAATAAARKATAAEAAAESAATKPFAPDTPGELATTGTAASEKSAAVQPITDAVPAKNAALAAQVIQVEEKSTRKATVVAAAPPLTTSGVASAPKASESKARAKRRMSKPLLKMQASLTNFDLPDPLATLDLRRPSTKRHNGRSSALREIPPGLDLRRPSSKRKASRPALAVLQAGDTTLAALEQNTTTISETSGADQAERHVYVAPRAAKKARPTSRDAARRLMDLDEPLSAAVLPAQKRTPSKKSKNKKAASKRVVEHGGIRATGKSAAANAGDPQKPGKVTSLGASAVPTGAEQQNPAAVKNPPAARAKEQPVLEGHGWSVDTDPGATARVAGSMRTPVNPSKPLRKGGKKKTTKRPKSPSNALTNAAAPRKAVAAVPRPVVTVNATKSAATAIAGVADPTSATATPGPAPSVSTPQAAVSSSGTQVQAPVKQEDVWQDDVAGGGSEIDEEALQEEKEAKLQPHRYPSGSGVQAVRSMASTGRSLLDTDAIKTVHHPWNMPAFRHDSPAVEYVEREAARMRKGGGDADGMVGESDGADSDADFDSNEDSDTDDDEGVAEEPPQGTEDWKLWDKARRRKERRRKRRLLNITSSAHAARVDQAFEAKRRSQLMADIELGKRIDALLEAKQDALDTAKHRLTSGVELGLAALLKKA